MRLRSAGGPVHVQPETLNVAPSVLALPLARPARRAAAMLVDLTLVGLLSAMANVWLLAGLGLLLLDTVRRERGRRPTKAWRLAAAPLLAAGLWFGVTDFGNGSAKVLSDDETADVADAAEVAQALTEAASAAHRPVLTAALGVAAQQASSALTMAAHQAQATARAHERAASAAEAARGGRVTGRLATWRQRARELLDELGLGYGGALLYFTLLPAWWRGQTPGKRLLGLRVMELTGAPMTVMVALKRYGGYAAGLATGGVGLAQPLWDRNRQAIQDRCAHTVVVDEREAVAAARRAPEAPPA